MILAGQKAFDNPNDPNRDKLVQLLIVRSTTSSLRRCVCLEGGRPHSRSPERGLAASARAGTPATQRDLLMQCALVQETAGDPVAALAQVETALRVPGDRIEPIDRLRLTISEVRLLRKIGPKRDQDRRAAIDRALKLLTSDRAKRLESTACVVAGKS